MHNSRLARFFSIDPLTSEYPYLTPYQFSSNQPIHAPELEGLESANELSAEKSDEQVYGEVGVDFLNLFQPLFEWIDEHVFEETKPSDQFEVYSTSAKTPSGGEVSGSVYYETSTTTTTESKFSQLAKYPSIFINPNNGLIDLPSLYTHTVKEDFTLNAKLSVKQKVGLVDVKFSNKLSYSFVTQETWFTSTLTEGVSYKKENEWWEVGGELSLFQEYKFNFTTGESKFSTGLQTLGFVGGNGVKHENRQRIGLNFKF